jgi:inosine-uridine nucleoside N-ribohydrolase
VIFAERTALELVAVTTVGRNAAVRARVAASLLGLAGLNEIETCVGEQEPVLRSASRFNWFDHEESCIADAPLAPISNEPAAERIVRAAREHPGLEIVAIGPMTNVARACALEPKLPSLLGGVTIMGGHIREVRIGSFVGPHGIDYNLCSDPEATLAVLGAGFNTTLVTADVTLQTWLRDAEVAALHGGSALQREIARQLEIWKPVQHAIFTSIGGDLAADNAAFLHDPLTLLALVDESSLQFEALRVIPTLERGVLRTIEAPAGTALGAPMRVATGVRPETARAQIAERLQRL